MTIPAMAPPDRPLEGDPPAPAEVLGLPEPVTLAVSEPVELGAGGNEAVVSPAGKGF
jgi:hypothetical protein